MLTLNFEIHKDNTDGEGQARGVVAALVAIYGPSVLPTTARHAAPASQAIALPLSMPDGYPVEAPQRDVTGIPWDERIHASTKTANKDGTWSRRRNTPDEVFDKVMAELKAANTAMTLEAAAGLTAPAPTPTAAEAFTPPVPAPPVAEAFTPPVPAPPVAEAFTPPVPAPPVAEAFTPPVPAPPVAMPQPPIPVPPMPTVDDRSAEAVEIMKAINAKQVSQGTLAEIMGAAGLKGLGEVFTAPIETRRVVAAALATL